MQSLFISTAIVGAVYFLFRKRTFDLYALAFFSATVYFLPGFFGYALYPTGVMREAVPLVAGTYWIMTTVLASFVAAAVLYDQLPPPRFAQVRLAHGQLVTVLLTGLGLTGLALTIATTGSAMLSADKTSMMMELNRWHILWVIAASLGLTCAFGEGRRWTMGLCGALVLLDVYIGFRSGFAIAMLAVLLLTLNGRGSQRLVVHSYRLLLAAVLLGMTAFVYKFLYAVVKLGRVDIITERLGDPGFYLLTVVRSEPFSTQAILNAVVETDLRVGLAHFDGLLYRLIVFAPVFGAETTSFNDLYQPLLFPGHHSGMANNIWAEMYSSGGWLLLLTFLGLFNLSLAVGSRLLGKLDARLRGALALLSAYWVFYINRNDLAYQLDLERRVLLVFLVAVAGSFLLVKAVSRKRRADASTVAEESS